MKENDPKASRQQSERLASDLTCSTAANMKPRNHKY